MKIEKSIDIRRKGSEVFNYLKFTKNQVNFSVWNMADPGMKKVFHGTDGTEGFVYTWSSANKNVGAGEQETKAIVDGKSIEFEVRFFSPMKNTCNEIHDLMIAAIPVDDRLPVYSSVIRDNRYSYQL
jgi:hypothetical protein